MRGVARPTRFGSGARLGRRVARAFALGIGFPSWLAAVPAGAQSALARPANLSGGWVGDAGILHFNFLHRFTASEPPERKVANSPTFLVAFGLPRRTLVGFNYATNSPVAPRYPNEWELFARVAPLARPRSPVDAALQAGYNVAAGSVDAELSAGRDVGRLRLLGAARVFSDGYRSGDARTALGAGAAARLTRHLALAADASTLLDRAEGERVAWSAGVQLAIPYSPHTLSLHATNATTGTLQGTSRGTDETLYGFEFTIPITLRRYLGRGQPRRDSVLTRAPATSVPAAAGSDTVQGAMRRLAFVPATFEISAGTTIVWRNEDPVPHTVTADDRQWDSGSIEPGATWRRTFGRPGTYPFHCTPHPFMKGTVVVR